MDTSSQIVVIRRAGPDDVDKLATLAGFVQDLHIANRPDVFRPTVASEVEGWFRACLARPNVRAWIAEQDGAAVGYALVMVHERPERVFSRASRWWELDQIGVLPPHQDTGIGWALLDRVRHEAQADGVSQLTVKSWAFNREARAAFERWGFTPRVVEFSLNVKP